jgi:hypothetical protein
MRCPRMPARKAFLTPIPTTRPADEPTNGVVTIRNCAHGGQVVLCEIVIGRDGSVWGIYGEEIDLAVLGPPWITRASQVEADSAGHWLADLSPVGGLTLGPFDQRSEALEAEVYWLGENWLILTS